KPTQGGIISCIAVPKHSGRQVYATGSYNGSIVVYAEPGNPIMHLDTGSAGVTQVQFTARVGHETGSPWYLVAGNRMDSRVFLWDARQIQKPLLVLHRRVENHQRFQFDFDPLCEYFFTGSQTGAVCVYDLSACLDDYHACQLVKPSLVWRAHSDCAHGLSVNPCLPLVATSSGQRRIRLPSIFTSRRAKRPRMPEPPADSCLDSALSSSNPTSSSGEAVARDNNGSSSDSHSSLSETGLTDEEASLIPPIQVDKTCASELITGERSLPLWGMHQRSHPVNLLDGWAMSHTKDSDGLKHLGEMMYDQMSFA
ncbi:unnamed protein product, partial [Echinostoma caproni]|uniref:WD repeat-containing protein 79 n=1 Tax=Echinostoma caproni TaxID=27848 RepID=A0A183AAW2_9TREM